MKCLNKYLAYGLQILLLLCVIAVFKCDVFAATSLSQDADGNYLINNADDYKKFVDDVHNQETYENQVILLKNDIIVVGEDYEAAYTFKGVFNGCDHEIDFTADNKKSKVNVFPFNIENAEIKNLNINIHERLYGSQVAYSWDTAFKHSVIDFISNSKLSNLSIYGDMTIIYDKAGNSIRLAAISGGENLIINNCRVAIKCDYDKENSLKDDDFTFSGNWQLYFNAIGQVNQSFTNMSIENCYSNCTYTDSINDFANFVDGKRNNNKKQGVVFKFMYCDTSASKVENVFFDKDIFPELAVGTNKLISDVANYTRPNNDSFAKSTADMKLKATYTGFDFDEVWGMSDIYNDGYPFIVAEDVKDAKKLIAALPAQITDADKTAVEAALKAYNALSDDQKLQVPADLVQALKDAEKAIEKKPEEQTKPQKQETKIKKGTKFIIAGNKYQVTGDKTASFIGGKNKKAKKITVPASVTYKKQTFKVTAIGPKACKGYKKLKVFVVGKNVITIGAQAFANTPKLKKLQVKSMALKKVGARACKGMHKKGVIKVPKKMLKKYKKLFKGKGQKKTVKIK